MFSTSYMAHTNAVKFYNELKDRSVPRFAQVVGVAMGAATFIYLAVMTLGFETFGLNSQVRGGRWAGRVGPVHAWAGIKGGMLHANV